MEESHGKGQNRAHGDRRRQEAGGCDARRREENYAGRCEADRGVQALLAPRSNDDEGGDGVNAACAASGRDAQAAPPPSTCVNPRSPPSLAKRPGASVSTVLRQQEEAKMADYDNTNRGALFRNDDKDPSDDRDRDYLGTLNVEGTEYWLSGWVRTAQKNGRKFLSLSVKPKQAKPAASEKPRADAGGSTPAFDDAIPF